MTAARLRPVSAGLSHQGLVRKNNEDRIHLDDARGIYAVVDGMGGHAAGEHAAEIAIERLRSRLERQTDGVEQRIREAIALANNAVYDAAAKHPEWRGMACVLTVAVVEQGVATVGHVGDSRLYKIRGGTIAKVTRDHSPVGEREDRGEIGEREAMRDPRRNEVFRDVGSEPHTPDDPDFIEMSRVPLEPDAALVLCTDGLTDALTSGEILRMVETHAGDGRTAVERLVEAANRVGKDNVSVVLVAGPRFGEAEKTAPLARAASWRRLAAVALGGVAAGVLGALAYQRFTSPQPVPEPRAPQRIVAGPGLSIAAALERAQAGDTVELPPGEYAERVWLKEGVALVAQKPREAVLRPPAAGEAGAAAITADRIQGARVWGLKIAGAGESALATGIAVANSNVEIQHCEITGARLAAVEYTGVSGGALEGSYIHHNAGAGVIVREPAAPAIEHNTIVENGKGPKRLLPGLILLSNARPMVVANTIAGNGAEAIWTAVEPEAGALERNFFSLDGKRPARRPVRVLRPGETP